MEKKGEKTNYLLEQFLILVALLVCFPLKNQNRVVTYLVADESMINPCDTELFLQPKLMHRIILVREMVYGCIYTSTHYFLPCYF